jgi:hypothetical protein
MARHKDQQWSLPEGTPKPGGGAEHSWRSIKVALLMDIRDELKQLNRLLHCSNFLNIPSELGHIRRNTLKPRRTQKPKDVPI